MTRRILLTLLLLIPFSSQGAYRVLPTPTEIHESDIPAPKLLKRDRGIFEAAVKIINGYVTGSGTYFKYRSHRFVITAAHVVAEADQVKVKSSVRTLTGDVILVDEADDIAVIKVDDLGVKPIAYHRLKKLPRVGEKTYTVSYPMIHDRLGFRGEVAGYWIDENDFNVLSHGYAWPGASGAAVFNSHGQVIGIVSAIETGRLGNLHLQAIPSIVWIKPISLLEHDVLVEELKTNK